MVVILCFWNYNAIFAYATSNSTKEPVHCSLHLHKLLRGVVWQNLQVLLELINNTGFNYQLIGIHEVFDGF